LISCKKESPVTGQQAPVNELVSGSGSGNGGGGGGGGTTTGFLQNIFPGLAYRLVAGNSSSVFVSFTQPSQAGWILKLASNNPNVQIPATYAVPAGVFNVEPPITSSPVTNSQMVTISVTLGAQTKSTTFKIFPATAAFPAPQLQSPGDRAGFKNRIQVKFTWSDNANAYYHDIQISDNPQFNGTPMAEVYLNDPIWAASYFNGLGVRYWRVRYVDASGNFGPWSTIRSFEIKP
ncbi:MAG: hypothetical protein WCF67_04105, partial [Chitinophagaceae bacterium]